MSPVATVLIPTFDHGPTLHYSVASVLSQSVKDLELFVIGDGVPDITREIMSEFIDTDERVRFFDNPKGPRHGEIHRHVALQEARGEIICYLSDDDLYFPDHVEHMLAALAQVDFAHALPFRIDSDGSAHVWPVDLTWPEYRRLILEVENRIPLSCGAHTTDLYRRLEHGWRTTPADTPTDLYMWRQILASPGCRVMSVMYPTAIHFPSPHRTEWTAQQRLEELDRYHRKLEDPTCREEFEREIAAARLASIEAERRTMLTQIADHHAQRAEYDRQIQEMVADNQQQRRAFLKKVADHQQQRRAFLKEVNEYRSSRWWRLRRILTRLPGFGRWRVNDSGSGESSP